jgi:hypothetical protein
VLQCYATGYKSHLMAHAGEDFGPFQQSQNFDVKLI